MMDISSKTIPFSCVFLISLFVSSSAQSCSTYTFANTNNLFSRCNDLPYLNSFLHWNYHQSNSTVDIAYRHTGISSTQWVAWALNLQGTGMIGAQSLVAFHNTSGAVRAYTVPVTSYGTQMAEGNLSFNVPKITAEYVNSEMIIYATLELPSNQTTFNQVWQEGPVSGNTLNVHPMANSNKNSLGSVNFLSDQNTVSPTGGAVIPRLKRKNVHGVLNAVSWGILLPLGAVIARYLKVFKSGDPAWFYLHVACQSSAYAVGVAGWATGLKLGSDSKGLKEETHGNIGLVLFILGTLQVFALLLRPKKDHKYRLYWNIYHHSVGYTVIVLSIINVFKGLEILDPAEKWKKAYIGVLIFLGVNAAMLEAFTWYLVIKRKKAGSDKHPHAANGTNGVSDYGSRPQQAV
ncbi:cytochrome b561 and DOMON domain-containing protein At5g47530-like [Cornus florida]|uniref:cytochrome b561 and DOMON domain-containing protein At5g47530-like n=1 Tax=Cornus florida TaxID=4283 RepID=UPI0028A25705|nr:cytochrome b561 and DOMON domain-containing protein At5g47530-like [Cornus florida]